MLHIVSSVNCNKCTKRVHSKSTITGSLRGTILVSENEKNPLCDNLIISTQEKNCRVYGTFLVYITSPVTSIVRTQRAPNGYAIVILPSHHILICWNIEVIYSSIVLRNIESSIKHIKSSGMSELSFWLH